MPVAYATLNRQAYIIQPDSNERLIVNIGSRIKLSCSTSFFDLHFLYNINISDIVVTCAQGNRFVINGFGNLTYRYDQLKCKYPVYSTMKVTNRHCRPYGKIIEVGYPVGRTNSSVQTFIKLYSVCFDSSEKKTLYSWYYPRSPYTDFYQSKRNTHTRFFQLEKEKGTNVDPFGTLDVAQAYDQYKDVSISLQ